MSETQAQEAIVGPAQREGDFVSPIFAYSPEALKVMTQKLAASKSSQRSGIEAFQLQILCEYLEDKVIKGEIPGPRVEPQHFAEQIDEIFEGYYQRLLDKLEPGAQEAAQLLIEEKLLFEDANTGEARRLGVDSGVLLAEKGISQALLNQLESNFLLCRESTSTGGFNYEVSHDTLIAPILKSKAERKALERVERERVEAKKRRNRLLAILGLTGLILAVVVGVLLYILKISAANRQQALTAYANDLAYKSTIALERGDRTTAFQLAVMAHRYVQQDNLIVTRALIEALYYNDVFSHSSLPWSAALEGHRSYVRSVAFSPDGKRLATGSYDQSAKIWEIDADGVIQKANKNRRLSSLSGPQLISYNLETLLDLHPDNESKLIATREVWQIKGFADLAAAQAGGSNVLSRVEAPYARANRLYAAALAIQDELLIKMDWAKMLRKWAAVYRDDEKETKAKELEGKADGLWKEE